MLQETVVVGNCRYASMKGVSTRTMLQAHATRVAACGAAARGVKMHEGYTREGGRREQGNKRRVGVLLLLQ